MGGLVLIHSIHSCMRRKHLMLDLIVIVVTIISFFALIGLTVGCDRL